MENKIMELFVKYKDIILYLFFGVCTTVVNVVTYWGLSELSLFPKGINAVANTWIAWFVSVVFAYVTNRKWVFESKVSGIKAIIGEIGAFFACRVTTGIMDAVIMYVFVDRMHFNNMLVKILSNVLVIILNYVGSKLLVFRKKKDK